ncbi:MAG: ATP-dependent Clp protease adaptor ClpS [Nitrospinae bacterium]|nr:ATP-dependent Clp protease adaptor ClpS [Nitrospinota bacterium]MBF0633270.1 ATP-dependent Clp protease adaptor ClpS [Nitrospinota bacterium]
MGRTTKYQPTPHMDDETSTRESLAPLYWVVMHNDPVTTMEFVVEILMRMYDYGQERAVEVMLSIHHNGLERVALMPLERAEFKVQGTHAAARARGFPLTCTIEPEQAP